VEQSFIYDRDPISRWPPSVTNTRTPLFICTVPRTEKRAFHPSWIEQGIGVKLANPRKRNDPAGMSILEPLPTFKRVPLERTHHPLNRILQYRVRRIDTCSSTLRKTSPLKPPLLSGIIRRVRCCGVRAPSRPSI
jgi:hypothetical protein